MIHKTIDFALITSTPIEEIQIIKEILHYAAIPGHYVATHTASHLESPMLPMRYPNPP